MSEHELAVGIADAEQVGDLKPGGQETNMKEVVNDFSTLLTV